MKYFLSERISQDPLENFFGCQRQRGGTSENPNVKDFCKNTQALRVINSVCGTVSKGNSRGNKQMIDLQTENKPLPKRHKAKENKVPLKKLPTRLGDTNSSDSECKDPIKLPDLSPTKELTAALSLPISKKEDHTDTKSDHDIESSEDIISPDISPITSEISDDDIESACAGEVLGFLSTTMNADSDMELSEGIESTGVSPEIPEDEDELFLLDLPMTSNLTDNPDLELCHAMDSKSTPPIVRPKSSAEEERITCTLAAGPGDEKIVSFCNITLRRQDFWTLKSMEWLNDQVHNLICCTAIIFATSIAGHQLLHETVIREFY